MKKKKDNRGVARYATPYKYAELCGVSTQAIYDRIKNGSLEILTKEDFMGIPKAVIDMKKFPPKKGRKKVENIS